VVRIAATYCLGFRATLGRVRLRHPFAPERRTGSTPPQRQPSAVAAAVFNARADERETIRAQLVERAALHVDAHLVKYTVACLVAAERDPQETALYHAAAAYLGAWWDLQ
jgi:hypothetical protein